MRTTKYRDDCEEYYLAGHSLGGNIVAQYAKFYPDKLKKLILLAPAGMPF